MQLAFVSIILILSVLCLSVSAEALVVPVKSNVIHGERALRPSGRPEGCLRTTKLNFVNERTATILAGASKVVAPVPVKSVADVVAKALGYVMGLGAISVYLPIIISLVQKKSAEGFSTATWIYNVIGLSLACLYPFKKGFPVSTYVEVLAVAIQSVGILGLISFLRGTTKEFLAGFAVFVALTVYSVKATIAPNLLAALQVISILICNYANIPQIILTFQRKKASWSVITAGMR
jgi:hypothetical protein